MCCNVWTHNREGRVILLRSVSFEIEIKSLFSNDVEFACLISFSILLVDRGKIIHLQCIALRNWKLV